MYHLGAAGEASSSGTECPDDRLYRRTFDGGIDEYSFDDDGRLSTLDSFVRGTTDSLTVVSATHGPGTYEDAATELAVMAVDVNGGTYKYWYDAFGRRRLKVYPTDNRDEMFYLRISAIVIAQIARS